MITKDSWSPIMFNVLLLVNDIDDGCELQINSNNILCNDHTVNIRFLDKSYFGSPV